jgi:hypothetical protein
VSFAIAAGLRQCSHRDHILLSQIRDFSFSSPPTTRRATVEVFDPASTRDTLLCFGYSGYLVIWQPHGPPHRNTAPLLLRVILFGFPRDRYLASPLARWLLPSNRKHSSYCYVRVFRAWPRDGRSSIFACASVAGCLWSRCLVML